MKENHIKRFRTPDKTITVDSEYAQENFEELTDRVCRENIAIIVRDSKGSVVLVPCWWYHLNFNNDRRGNINEKQYICTSDPYRPGAVHEGAAGPFAI